MVKIVHSFVLMAAAAASEDGEAMLQVGKVGQHAHALAQTDSKVRASRHQQALQMESNFEKLAAEAVRTGDTPSLGTDARSAVNSALDTLEHELENEKIANDALMVGANARCSACNTGREDAFARSVNPLKSSLEEARNLHAECRTSEDPNCGDEKTTCDDQDNFARTAHTAAPHCVCEAVDIVNAVEQKVCLEGAVTWGEQYNTALGNKIAACDQAKQAVEEVAQVCDGKQVTFEMAVCTYKVSLTTTCQNHGLCYAEALANRETVMTDLKLKEASEKIMWKSCKKVRCYLDMLDATKVNQADFDECKRQEADTAHLDVVYPDAPPKEDCDTSSVSAVPGDPAWLEAEYARLAPTRTWLPKRKGIEHVTPCPQQTSLVLPTQPTEQTRLGENGGGIFEPQPMILEPQPAVAASAAATTQDVDFGGDNSAYFHDPVDNHIYGCAKGWTCEGKAQMSRLSSNSHGHYEDSSGERISSTFGKYYFDMGYDGDMGKATSAPFQLPQTAVKAVFWRSGGADADRSGLVIKTASDNAVICRGGNGKNTNTFFLDECKFPGHGGTRVYIVMEDAVAGGWGKVYIDDIRFLNAAGEVVAPDDVSTDVAYTESVSTRCDNNPDGYLPQYNTLGKCRDACSEDLSCSAFTYAGGYGTYCVLINDGAVCDQIDKAGKTSLFVKAA